jgi:hypothetical protein
MIGQVSVSDEIKKEISNQFIKFLKIFYAKWNHYVKNVNLELINPFASGFLSFDEYNKSV